MRFGYSLQIGRKLSQDAVYQTLPGCFPSLITTTVQPLWNPAQPQPEQRQLIPRDSFFLLSRFLEKLSCPNRIRGNG